MAACSATEENAWRDRLSGRITMETQQLTEGQAAPISLSSPLTSEMRSTGKAFGRGGGFIRRLSIQRTATLGPVADLNQVIIKHTQALKESSSNSSTSSLPIPRSNSVMTPSHVPTLAPLRNERIKLELALSDVWTKDAIPFPGMGTRRTELSFRETANDLIRKLSMASITSNFSKRSMSYTGINNTYPTSSKAMSKTSRRPESSKPKRPPLVDFHNAPEAFLPEDFELQDPKRSRRMGLRTLTMTYERPRSPFFFSENKAPDLKRTKSVAQHQEQIGNGPGRREEATCYTPSRTGNATPVHFRFEFPKMAGIERDAGSPDLGTVRKKPKAKLLKFLTGRSRAFDE